MGADLALLAAESEAFGLPLSAKQLEQFARFLALLLTWNERLNLTAVRDPHAIQIRHFLDSLSCATVTGELNGRALIDVGSGAGFPGLPLKILYPDLRLTLVESVIKKTRFLTAVVEELALSRVEIIPERAEALGQNPAHREQYDWATARGVAQMATLAEYLLPLCRVGGHMLAQKGENAKKETAVAQTAIHTLGGSKPTLHAIHLPGQAQPHYLVVIEKTAVTPPKFPRRPGIPAKRPL
jgi:16S rRNA (guanine527-N7)-methyltransferase